MVSYHIRMRCLSLLLALFVQGQASAAGNLRNCICSVPIATFQLRVTPRGGGPPLPIRQVNTIPRGSKLGCTPVKLPPDLKKSARVAVVLVPATAGDAVTVLDLRTLDGPTEWSIPLQPGAVLLVFGPQGLDEKRVNNLVSK